MYNMKEALGLIPNTTKKGGRGAGEGRTTTQGTGWTILSFLKHVTVYSLFLFMKDKREKQENERVD